MPLSVLFVISEEDPVARGVADVWGALPPTGIELEGSPVLALRPGVGVVRRAGWHVRDAALSDLLVREPETAHAVVIFPSVHRAESGTPCFTVHPLGNFGPSAEVGGEPRRLVPTAPRLMAAALRALADVAPSVGLHATFESTHHGPLLAQPAFFAEIGFADAPQPPEAAVRALSGVMAELREDPADHVAVGVGGGHYVPHFTELALERRWAFGHLISRHAFAAATAAELADAQQKTAGSEGFLFARAADAEDPKVEGLGRRVRDAEAPRRSGATPSASSRPSGT